jgi:hypothetical protein
MIMRMERYSYKKNTKKNWETLKQTHKVNGKIWIK